MLRTRTRQTTKARARRVRAFVPLLSALALCAAAMSAAGQEAWEKTPYPSWGSAEVKGVLEASPWSRVFEGETAISPATFGVSGPKGKEKLTVLLRSALPVRQALLRERQLASKYDKMNAADRAAFDAKNKALLDCPACGKYYVVSVTCFHSCFSGTFVEDYKKAFYLTNETGERRQLAGASLLSDDKDGVALFFTRLNDKGEPLLKPESKELTVHFAFQALVNHKITNEKYTFDVAKLIRGGHVMF